MESKFDIKDIQNMNLFSLVTKVIARDCFGYNSSVIFVVHPALFTKAVGPGGINVRKLSERIRKKVKIVREPPDQINTPNIERFILSVVYPVRFRKLIFENAQLTISAGPQAKASLLGRESVKLNELRDIVNKYFKIKALKIA